MGQTPQSTLTDDLTEAAAATPPDSSADGGDALSDLKSRLSALEAERAELAREKEQLARYREMGRRMMRNDGTFTPEREEAMRFLMDDSGFTPDEIERWIEVQRAQAEGDFGDDEGADEPPTSGDDEMADQPRAGADDPRDREIQELRSRLERLTEHVSATQTSTLESRINDQVGKALDSHQGVSSLLGVASRLAGEEGADQRRQMFAEDLRQQTVAELRRRKARGGQFREDWIPEAVNKAAADITERYRSVIGDPDKIRRSPETGTGQDELRHIEPPKAPEFERGDDAGSVSAKARNYTEGTLLSIAQEASKDGQTLT